MNERFFLLCLDKLSEKQEELAQIIGVEKEYSPMMEALKEKGMIQEEVEKGDMIEELYRVARFAAWRLNCSFIEAWNSDYIDIYEALIFETRNGG
jgi:hypothetical protein